MEVPWSAERYTLLPEGERQRVTQTFCSALSCGYSDGSEEQWEPLARVVLDAAYEATLADHKRITRKYAQFAKHPYRTLRGGKITGWFRPDKLPRALPSFADALDFEGESSPDPRSGPS